MHRPDDAVARARRRSRTTESDRERCRPSLAPLVGDERDRVLVGAERRAGEHQAAHGRLERGLDPVAPGAGVAGVVDLVEDDQRAPGHRAPPVHRRGHADLRVGDARRRGSRGTECTSALRNVGSSWMPTRAAACAHCVFRCSVGATTVTASTVPSASSSAAIRRANVVLPAPGRGDRQEVRGCAGAGTPPAPCAARPQRREGLQVRQWRTQAATIPSDSQNSLRAARRRTQHSGSGADGRSRGHGLPAPTSDEQRRSAVRP